MRPVILSRPENTARRMTDLFGRRSAAARGRERRAAPASPAPGVRPAAPRTGSSAARTSYGILGSGCAARTNLSLPASRRRNRRSLSAGRWRAASILAGARLPACPSGWADGAIARDAACIFLGRGRIDGMMQPAIPPGRRHRGLADAGVNHPAALEAKRRIGLLAAVIYVSELVLANRAVQPGVKWCSASDRSTR